MSITMDSAKDLDSAMGVEESWKPYLNGKILLNLLKYFSSFAAVKIGKKKVCTIIC